MHTITKDRFDELGIGWSKEKCRECPNREVCEFTQRRVKEPDEICPKVDEDEIRKKMTDEEFYHYRHNMLYVAQQPSLMQALAVSLYHIMEEGADLMCSVGFMEEAFQLDSTASLKKLKKLFTCCHIQTIQIRSLLFDKFYLIKTEELLNFDVMAKELLITTTSGELDIVYKM